MNEYIFTEDYQLHYLFLSQQQHEQSNLTFRTIRESLESNMAAEFRKSRSDAASIV